MKYTVFDVKEIIGDWDYEKNIGIDPKSTSIHSKQRVWWKCSKCGYEWQTQIISRAKGRTKCPKCSKTILIPGVNDLVTKFPEVAKEWNYERNKDLRPENFRYSAHKEVWWKCPKCGYEWKCTINRRTNNLTKCPACTRCSSPLKGINDLQTVNPSFFEERDFEKNIDILPNEIKIGSNKKVWWKCRICGFSWQASPYARFLGSNCPHCNSTNQTSFPEQAIYFYLKKVFPDAINKYKNKILGRMELDIYIPSIKTAIEYDGKKWHNKNTINKELKKYQICLKNGIKLYRIKEEDTKTTFKTCDVLYLINYSKKIEDFGSSIKNFLQFFTNKSLNCEVNLFKDEKEIRGLYQGFIKDSLSELYPDIAKEWHPTKNGDLKPSYFHYGSEFKAWWKCSKCGYEWQTSIKHRTRAKPTGCPVCTHQLVVKGLNDFETLYPEIAKEWHPTKNGDLKPDQVINYSGKKIWWKCSKCGYEWQATLAHRKFSKSGCPSCAGKVVIPGVNDLETLYPEIAKEWHPTKNGDLKPSQVFPKSNKKVWWICSICGKEWQSVIATKVSNHSLNCRSCNIKKRYKKL